MLWSGTWWGRRLGVVLKDYWTVLSLWGSALEPVMFSLSLLHWDKGNVHLLFDLPLCSFVGCVLKPLSFSLSLLLCCRWCWWETPGWGRPVCWCASKMEPSWQEASSLLWASTSGWVGMDNTWTHTHTHISIKRVTFNQCASYLIFVSKMGPFLAERFNRLFPEQIFSCVFMPSGWKCFLCGYPSLWKTYRFLN